MRNPPAPRILFTGFAKHGALDWHGTGTDADAQIYRNALCILMPEVYCRYLASSRG
jgi:hypothetical protein